MDNRKSKRKNAVRRLHLNNVFTISRGAFALFFVSQVALANKCPPEEAVARVESLQGQLIVNNQPIAKGALVCADDLLTTGLYSRAALRLFETQTLMRLDQQTQTRIQASQQPRKSWLEMLEGMIHLFSRDPRALEVDTPLANAAVEGTEFVVRVTEQQVQVTVVEGDVQVTNNQGALALDDRQTAFVSPGRAPRLSTLITPEQAVQWTLYYPPLLFSLIDTDQLPTNLRTILSDFNNANQALTQLTQIPLAQRNEAYFVYQAGWLLAVGQVPQAQQALAQALEINPASAPAQALKAIIAVTQNDELMALALAKEAIQSDPDSAVGYLALSYAQQAAFQLDEALDSVQQAVANNPDNALAKARLAELLLAQGKLDDAVDVAEQAAAQAPDLARTQTVLGFAYLSRIDTKRAKDAFEKAIALDQAAPLPRLGLGLAQIRESDLEEGRENLETAVALDPLRSLYRSYLGKAYFEEKRDALAGDQYTLAKQFDPMDPTPWLYSAILKQTQNRPVEALEDIQQSIKLNDNRAVYRSRLLLDEDRAARGTSLARIYDDLGFEQLAVTEASRSLSIDPANYSAHRFLADAYAKRPRHEIARVSELLQAQLLQPVNLSPVQPSLSVTDLNLLVRNEALETGFNEFTSLFERNQTRLLATGFFGNKETWGDEIVLSGLHKSFSYSLGQFHSETDGFRDNNDVENDLYNIFTQFAITPSINLQAEYRRRETEQGDVRLNFDPDNFSRDQRRNLLQDTWRVGWHLAPSEENTLIASLIYSDRDVSTNQFPAPLFNIREESNENGYDLQSQYLRRTDRYNLVVGGGILDIDRNSVTTTSRSLPIPNLPVFTTTQTSTSNLEQHNIYSYLDFHLLQNINAKIGLSYEAFDDELLDTHKINPKIGIRWPFNDHLTWRIAVFQTLKRSLIADQTLEPTQFVGFNQFYDDPNGSETRILTSGLDINFSNNFFSGLEIRYRDLDVPQRLTTSDGAPQRITFNDQDEYLFRGYFYGLINDRWSVSLELQYEKIQPNESDTQRIEETRTFTLPLSIRFFSQNGFFTFLTSTYLDQEVNQSSTLAFNQSNESAVIHDILFGFRFPKRLGLASLEIKNLFNKNFLYQDLNFITPERTRDSFLSKERIIFGRLTFNF